MHSERYYSVDNNYYTNYSLTVMLILTLKVDVFYFSRKSEL